MTDCIVWHGGRMAGGYGGLNGRLAHRHVWEQCFGPLPPLVTLHHTCENLPCVNPAHLQPMTRSEHSALHRNPRSWWERQRAATHCKHGHEFTEANTYWSRRGMRHCRTCDRLRHRRYKAAKVEALGKLV